MKLYLDLDMEKCSACGACAVACMDQNDIDPDSELPFRNVFCVDRRDSAGERLRVPLLYALRRRPCVPACPSACLAKDAGDRLHPLRQPELHRLPLLRHGLPLRRPLLQP